MNLYGVGIIFAFIIYTLLQAITLSFIIWFRDMPVGFMGKKGRPWGLAHGTSSRKGMRIPGESLIPQISPSAFAFSIISACFIILIPPDAPAAGVTIAWSPSLDRNVAGYKIYYGPTSRDNQFQVDAGKNTSITITNVQAGSAYSKQE